MLKSNAPTKLTVAFASGSGAGPVNAIPLTPNATAGTASYQTGFTTVNMEPIAAGGVPPYGADMNGLFQAQTTAQIWQQSGYMSQFDPAFAAAPNIGGYPTGAVLMMGSGKGLWINQSDNNAASPDANGATGWLGLAAAGASTIATTGGVITPDPSLLGVTTLLVTGALTSNATIILPLTAGAKWIVVNNTSGAYTLTVQGASGSGIAVAPGNPLNVFTDGTNYYGVSAALSGAYLPINGTAVAATKLATARTLSASGAITWSVSFDGSANVSAQAALSYGAVALGNMANFQANSLMGNPTSNSAVPSAITLQNGLQFNGSSLGLGAISVSGLSNTGNANVQGLLTAGAATINGNLTLYAGQLVQNTLTPNDRYHYIQTNSVVRWRFGADSVAENGSNAGSNWELTAFSDSGAYLASVMTGIRATGQIVFGTRPSFGGAIPWDSENITPLDRNVGGTIGAPISISGENPSPLMLSSSATNDTFAQISNTSSGGRSWAIGTTGSNAGIGAAGSFFIYDNTINVPRMIIDPTAGAATFSGAITCAGLTSTESATFAGGILVNSSMRLVDGQYTWTIWDNAGTLNIGDIGNGSAFTLDPGGDLHTTGSMTPGSDRRVKDGDEVITDALAIVERALVGKTYRRNDQGGKLEAGFIAQEVEAHLPHLVSIGSAGAYDDFHFLDYDHTAPYLANAITELAHEVRALRAKMESGHG